MNVVVSGATGLIGRALVRHLLSVGHAVTGLTRDAQRALRTLPARCMIAEWDPCGAPLDPVIFRDVEAVVHLAGEGVADGRWTPSRRRAIRASRVDSARSLVHAIAALPSQARPRVFVSASAIGYYGDRGHAPLDEQARVGDGFLADVCREWEDAVCAATTLGVRTAAVRVGIVLAKEGGAFPQMLIPFRLGVGGRLGSGSQWMSWIHVDDIVGLFAYLLAHPEARGVVNGVAPEPVTNAEFTATLARALGRRALLPVPSAALRLGLGEMSQILLASQRVYPRVGERLGFNFRYPTLSGALGDLCADKSRTLEREQWLPRSPAEVFRFFSNAYNLEHITPRFLRFRVLGVTSREVGKGTRIDYRLTLHGVPFRWQSQIESWEPNRRFVDVQTRGPYTLWHHTHEFEAQAGGTLMRDRVRYQLPLGALGELIAARLVRRDVETIFDFRRSAIGALFG